MKFAVKSSCLLGLDLPCKPCAFLSLHACQSSNQLHQEELSARIKCFDSAASKLNLKTFEAFI